MPDSEAEPEPDAEPKVEAELEPEVNLKINPGGAEVAGEVKQDETKLDPQPDHHAGVLNMLAQIEHWYALLRERHCIEKLDNLAIEEAMVVQHL